MLNSEMKIKNVGFVNIGFCLWGHAPNAINLRAGGTKFINKTLNEKMLIFKIACENMGFINIHATRTI